MLVTVLSRPWRKTTSKLQTAMWLRDWSRSQISCAVATGPCIHTRSLLKRNYKSWILRNQLNLRERNLQDYGWRDWCVRAALRGRTRQLWHFFSRIFNCFRGRGVAASGLLLAARGPSLFATSLFLQRASDLQVSAAACVVRPLGFSTSKKRVHRGRRFAGSLLRRRNAHYDRSFNACYAANSCGVLDWGIWPNFYWVS